MARKIIFGTYDTDLTGGWTLSGWKLSRPEQQTNFVAVPGRKVGPLDLTAILTDGEPVYGPRTLTVTLEQSNGSRLDREALINSMINDLDGYRMKIVLPDDTEHFIQGRVSVEKDYNDLAHAAISVEAICDPWRYDNDETVVTGTASSTVKTLTLENPGRLSVSPVLVVTGGPVSLSFGTATWNLTAGTYTLPDLFLPSGAEETLTYSGTGTIKLTWRGAVL